MELDLKRKKKIMQLGLKKKPSLYSLLILFINIIVNAHHLKTGHTQAINLFNIYDYLNITQTYYKPTINPTLARSNR